MTEANPAEQRARMQVLLTFDVEVWCNGWQALDAEFPDAFRCHVYGSSRAGEYGLPKTLDILRRNRLRAVFFVEPLFAARFGLQHLRTIVALIQDAGQDVQLHLHPEWTDEIRPAPLPNIPGKRQHLHYYSLPEQQALLELGIGLMQQAGAARPTAFRAGSFAANRDTYRALAAVELRCDSSIDTTAAHSVPDLRRELEDLHSPQQIEGVRCYPMSVFEDGGGRLRHAQVGACSAAELAQAMQCAQAAGWHQFIVLSHSFEMLKRPSGKPDWIVVRRFEQLCRFLAREAERFPTATFADLPARDDHTSIPVPRVALAATLRRWGEQAFRRIV